MPSIKKVAEVAGVSVGTVSHVVTGSVPVSDELRLKVQAAIRELNYHPNHVARSLKTSKTRTLGIIVPDMTISFFPQVIRGAETAARKRGYWLIAVNSDDDGARQHELFSLLRSQRVEGMLLVVAASPTPISQISRILDAGIPVVCLDRIPDRVPVDTVSVEDTEAAEMDVNHLISMGLRRIAVVTGPLALKNERRRVQGYLRALERAGIPVEEQLISQGNLRPADVTALCREKLAVESSRPEERA
ncbi:MAG: LacI family DNA-binding transcriptional regulator [Bryobacteraceae bacterium]